MLLRTVTAASSVEGCSLVTRLQGNVQQTDFWNEFFAPPADMVHDAMQRWLADSGLCMAFLDPRGRSPADLVLEARLIALLGDETGPRAPAARIYLQTLLLDLDRVPKRMLARGDDNRRVPNSSLTPEVLAPPCRRRSRWCWPTSSMFCAASLRESSALCRRVRHAASGCASGAARSTAGSASMAASARKRVGKGASSMPNRRAL